MSIREKFVERFGWDEAVALETAALEHGNGINNQYIGTDPFKWTLLICIGYQCMEIDTYREYHKITAPWIELKEWIREEAELGTHDGDSDYLSLIAGIYSDFIKEEM